MNVELVLLLKRRAQRYEQGGNLREFALEEWADADGVIVPVTVSRILGPGKSTAPKSGAHKARMRDLERVVKSHST